MTLKQYIGTRVRQIRKEKNLSQQQLSEKAEVGIDYISNLETKGSNIKVDTLEKSFLLLKLKYLIFSSSGFNNKLQCIERVKQASNQET